MKKSNVMTTLILVFAAMNIVMFQNCDKKMKFSTATGGSFDIDEGDGTGGDYDPSESDGIPDPNNPNDPDNPTDPVDDPVCTIDFEDIVTPVKVLFLIDVSGSNKINTNDGSVGTDVNKSWRKDILNKLKVVGNANFKFNYTVFRGNFSNPTDSNRLIQSLMPAAQFSNSSSDINSAMASFQSTEDLGKTPYQAALAKAKDLIQADIATDSVSKYSVIMITDGHPDPALAGNAADSANVASGFVQQIRNINPNRVNLNTVYYYSANQYSSTAVTILTKMAETGNGVFIKADSGNFGIDYKNVIRVPTNTCP